MTWATLRVLRTVLWRFHGVVGGGRCFLSYEKIAAAAKCCRDSVCVAIAALEDAGILTWVHRLTKIRRREQDLFGAWGSVCKVIRTSNGYRFLDPLDREPGRRILTRLPVNLSLCEQTAPVPALGNVDLAEGFANCPFFVGLDAPPSGGFVGAGDLRPAHQEVLHPGTGHRFPADLPRLVGTPAPDERGTV